MNITAKNFTLTEGIKQSISNKFKRFEKFTSSEKINVILDINKNRQKIEVFLTVKNKTLKAEAKHEDLYVAVDLVIDKMDTQIKRYIEKETSVKKESVRFAEYESSLKINEDIGIHDEPRIVKRKLVSSKPMFEKEAIAQMELLGHRSFIFFNEDINSICMLYKRHDGDYGVIEIE